MKLILSLSFFMFAFFSNAGEVEAGTPHTSAPFVISQLDDRKRKSKKTKRRRKRKCKQFGKKIYAG